MNRQNLPTFSPEPDLQNRIGEIRFPARATGHEARNEGRERL